LHSPLFFFLRKAKKNTKTVVIELRRPVYYSLVFLSTSTALNLPGYKLEVGQLPKEYMILINHATTNPIQCAQNLHHEWQNLSEEDLMQLLKKCYGAYVKNNGVPPKTTRTPSKDDYINETWILVQKRLSDTNRLADYIDRRNKRSGTPITLATIVYESVQNVARSSIKQQKVIRKNSFELPDDDYFNLFPSADNVERTAILQAAIAETCKELSPSDAKILAARREERTYREIASHVQKSSTAVQKSMKKIKKKLTEKGVSPL